MIDVRRIRSDYDAVRASLARRGDEGALRDLAQVAELDEKSRQISAERDDLRAKVNGLSKEVGQLRRDGDTSGAEALQEQSRELGDREREVAAAADEDVAVAVRVERSVYDGAAVTVDHVVTFTAINARTS